MKQMILAAAVLALGAPVWAGGMAQPVAEPVVAYPQTTIAPVADWTGPYVGLSLGYADLDGGDNIGAYGWLGGVHAGYRWNMGRLVLGGELDYLGTNVDNSSGSIELDSVTRLKLSAGGAMGSNLLYGLVGIAGAKATVGANDLSDTGWLAGVGMARAMNENWVLGGEAIYHRFNDFDNQGVDVDVLTLEVRASMKF